MLLVTNGSIDNDFCGSLPKCTFRGYGHDRSVNNIVIYGKLIDCERSRQKERMLHELTNTVPSVDRDR